MSGSSTLGDQLTVVQNVQFRLAKKKFLQCARQGKVKFETGMYALGHYGCSEGETKCTKCNRQMCQHEALACYNCDHLICNSCLWVGRLTEKVEELRGKLYEILVCPDCKDQLLNPPVPTPKKKSWSANYPSIFGRGSQLHRRGRRASALSQPLDDDDDYWNNLFGGGIWVP